jgi:ABC-type multidrug transport system fused ATPase/permease subunit
MSSKTKVRTLIDDLKVLSHFLKLTHKISKGYIPLMIVTAVFGSVAPFLAIIMPKYIIDELLGAKRVKWFISYVLLLILGNFVINIMNQILACKIQLARIKLNNGFELYLGEHIMNMDYENLEDPKILEMKEQAIYPINNQGAIWRMLDAILNLVRIGITIVGLTTIISMLNPFIIVAFIGMTLLSGVINKKGQKVQFELSRRLIPLNRKFGYYANLFTDFSMGKDMRIYNLAPYVGKKVDDYIDNSVSFLSKSFTTSGKYSGYNKIILMAEMILLYGYMVVQVIGSKIGIGDFSMYIAAGNNFTENINSFTDNFVLFRQMCHYLDSFVAFEQIPSRGDAGIRRVVDTNEYTIEFKHVYFKYPRSDNYTLKDINLTIHPGEKISVVGQNGAGKTTFIKLLCRLYVPDKGEILLNGVNINEYDYNEYMGLLSVVFQDYKLFSFHIKENITFDKTESVKDDIVLEVIDNVGLSEKVNELEKGIHTSLYKNFDKEGIELSGGQAQKLAIARAVYKNAPVIVLDEPTAALDPYAEYEIYTSFNKLIGENMAIYISHRLSSCKFCDKIAVFDEGELIELGNHKELVDNKGKYATMWDAQAMYYV